MPVENTDLQVQDPLVEPDVEQVVDLPEELEPERELTVLADEQPEQPEDDSIPDDEMFGVTVNGLEREIAAKDLPELLQMKDNYLASQQQLEADRAEVAKYGQFLNFVANDDWAKQVIQYRLQGHSPQKILKFLNTHYEGTEMAEQELDPVQAEIQATKAELAQMKQQMAQQSQAAQHNDLLNQNTSVLDAAWGDMGIEAPKANFPKIAAAMNKVASELYGDPNFHLATHRLTPLAAKKLWEATKDENPHLFTAAPTAAPNKISNSSVRRIMKKGVTPVQQIPGDKGANLGKGTPRLDTPQKKYSPDSAAETYKALFG